MGISMKGMPGTSNTKGKKGITPSSTPLDPNRTLSDGIAAKSTEDVIAEEPETVDAPDAPDASDVSDVAGLVKSPTFGLTAEVAYQKIQESEKLMHELTLPWQEKLDLVGNCLRIRNVMLTFLCERI